ncbi:MAG: hypothetical protein CL693_10715 [Cellvibrionaceae bacterium]|nr:hypothetical protein [Cellvibrionaceae bacterium]|tara:strand:- start:5667 stop:6041 length:375 start_codon:yes stop_codon:yes gene_type:complete
MLNQERRQAPRLRFDNDREGIVARIVWPVVDNSDSEVRFVDISRSGFGIQTEREFKVGMLLKLSVSVDGSDSVALVAVVCNRRVDRGGFRYGAYFEYDAPVGDQKVEGILSQLDQRIYHHLQAS